MFAVVTAFGIACIISNVKKFKLRKHILVMCGTLLFGASMCIHPLMIGLDVINSKPVAKEIKTILANDPDSIWIGIDGLITPNYLIACGAPTINSVNYVPNYEMWNILDPNKEYEEVWNRYAHVSIDLNEEDVSDYYLNSPDHLTMNLCKKDFDKLNVDYILSCHDIRGEWSEYLELEYSEFGIWLYKVK